MHSYEAISNAHKEADAFAKSFNPSSGYTAETANTTGAGGDQVDPFKVYKAFQPYSWSNFEPFEKLINTDLTLTERFANSTLFKPTEESINNRLRSYLIAPENLTGDQLDEYQTNIYNGRVDESLIDMKKLKKDAGAYGELEASREWSRSWLPGIFPIFGGWLYQKIKEKWRGRKYKKNPGLYLKELASKKVQMPTNTTATSTPIETVDVPVGTGGVVIPIPKQLTPQNIVAYENSLRMLGWIRTAGGTTR
jgi:hypothetical protein